MDSRLYNYLSAFVSARRLQLFDEIIQFRTKYITVVPENIYQSHNASAVLRTCDCFGIQDVHVIENKFQYTVNPEIALGASKWVNIYKHTGNGETINELRNSGYRIVATVPGKRAVNLEDFDLSSGKIALFFGSELTGLPEEIMAGADEFLKIPMVGFTESFNISVSAGIILHHLTYKLRNSSISWTLTDEEKLLIKTEWLKNSIKRSDLLLKKFYENNP